nr:MAG TPA: hypothetical protein [Caudoviricetes sp.]
MPLAFIASLRYNIISLILDFDGKVKHYFIIMQTSRPIRLSAVLLNNVKNKKIFHLLLAQNKILF